MKLAIVWLLGSIDQRHNSGRLQHAGTEEKVTTVDELVSLLNQEVQKEAHRSTRQISTKIGPIQCRTVQIIFRDLGLKCLSFSNTFAAYYCKFFGIYILQPSLATKLKCGGVFSNSFIANCPKSVPVKKIRKSVNIWQRLWTLPLVGDTCQSSRYAATPSRYRLMSDMSRLRNPNP